MPDLRTPGLDVSKFQPTVDWAKVKAAGMQFVFARASYGTGAATEPTFKSHWQGAKRRWPHPRRLSFLRARR